LFHYFYLIVRCINQKDEKNIYFLPLPFVNDRFECTANTDAYNWCDLDGFR
jgi:hypothetical protein